METELFKARISDTADISIKSSRPKYLGFLSAAEAVYAAGVVKNHPCEYSFFGGYEGAERVMLGCFPDWVEEQSFPIAAVTFKYRTEDKLTHRDFLGSLMALGIKRETVGDILTDKGRAVVFVTEDILNYIKTQVSKIGRVGVTVTEGYTLPLPLADEMISAAETAASDRLDCVVSALCGVSRGKAAELIETGLVTVNSIQILKLTKTVLAGDIITVRGKGRFNLDSLDGRTRKNRIIINYRKYI